MIVVRFGYVQFDALCNFEVTNLFVLHCTVTGMKKYKFQYSTFGMAPLITTEIFC